MLRLDVSFGLIIIIIIISPSENYNFLTQEYFRAVKEYSEATAFRSLYLAEFFLLTDARIWNKLISKLDKNQN